MNFSETLRLGSIALVGAGMIASAATAQTTWSLEGSSPSAGEYNSPPPLCPLPSAPPYNINPTATAACPTLSPFPFDCRFGGTAVDNDGHPSVGGPAEPLIINSDGFVIEFQTESGAYVTSAVVSGVVIPGAVSGVACDSAGDVYYLTDGFTVVGIGLPPGPASCGAPPVVVSLFGVPTNVPLCGLAYDPCTMTFWGCDSLGFVMNFDASGFPLGGFFATPDLTPDLTGVTVNTTNRSIQVTDGFTIAEFTPSGALVPPGAFALNANPYPVPLWGDPVVGLGFALRPQVYGTSCTSISTTAPSIGTSGGYSFAGNTGLTVFETGATPGTTAFCITSFTYNCPALTWGCGGFWVGFPLFLTFPLGTVPAAGTVTLPTPLPVASPNPCDLPVGVPLYFQFFNFGFGGQEQTEGLALTIGAI